MGLVTVGTTPAQAAPRNAARKTISMTNRSTGGQVIYLAKGQPSGLAIANAEYVLAVGESLHFLLLFDGPDIQDEWGAIASAAGATLYIGETSERGA